MREAERRGLEPDEPVDEIVRTDLGEQRTADFDSTLRRPIDGVALAREAHAELEARGA